MRFGIFVPQGWRHDLVDIDPADQWKTMKGLAQYYDAGPWESLWVFDHFHTVPVETEQATHEAWTLMSAFAATTDRIRLGQMCTCMSYRNPAYLAKVAATVDHISGGRTEMGIGGGWYEAEWRAYGYGFPPIGERLGRLREGVEIMKQAWTTGTATLDGKYYQVDGARVYPTPPQEGGIPLWIAGGGEKVTLRIAAEYAKYTNFGVSEETFAAKSELLREHCAEVGTDFGAITRSRNFTTVVGSSEAEVQSRVDQVEARLAKYIGDDVAAKNVSTFRNGSEEVLGGTPEQIVDRLKRMEKLGMEYAIVNFPEAAYDRSGIDMFVNEVIPALA